MHTHSMPVWLILPLVTSHRVCNCVSLLDTCNEAHEAHMQSQRITITKAYDHIVHKDCGELFDKLCGVAVVTRRTHNG